MVPSSRKAFRPSLNMPLLARKLGSTDLAVMGK
jgi:hypothetical protein